MKIQGWTSLIAVGMLAGTMSLMGCEKSDADKAGDAIDDMADKAGDVMDDAADKANDMIDKVEDAADEATGG
ncbi:MAG: hypothetical protein AAF432_15555 [Planctomycetota bacterium]